MNKEKGLQLQQKGLITKHNLIGSAGGTLGVNISRQARQAKRDYN